MLVVVVRCALCVVRCRLLLVVVRCLLAVRRCHCALFVVGFIVLVCRFLTLCNSYVSGLVVWCGLVFVLMLFDALWFGDVRRCCSLLFVVVGWYVSLVVVRRYGAVCGCFVVRRWCGLFVVRVCLFVGR